MIKHKCEHTIIYEGKRYKSVRGIVELPKAVDRFNPIKEKKVKKKEE